jgi:parvulin-like peptidyl-prolyl isomerase
VLARIGDTEIKTEEIRAALENLTPDEQAALQRDPALLNQVVRSLLVQRLVFKEAVAKQWEKQPGVVAQVERAREKVITESYLRSLSTPPETFPSDAELEAAYETNKAALLVPKQYRLAQVFIALSKNADKAATEKAQARLESLKKTLRQTGADFAAIAKAESDEKASAERGGEIGWLPEARMQPEIRGRVSALAKNMISEPVRLDDGWHIIKILDIKEPHTPALAEIRPQLVEQLRLQRTRANSDAHLNRLLQQNPVAINELALSGLVKKAEQ